MITRGRLVLAGVTVAALAGYATIASHPASSTGADTARTTAEHAASVKGPGEDAFVRAILADLDDPATTASVTGMKRWIHMETPSWPSTTPNNPLNTTLREPGSSPVNSVGVQRYPTAAEGAAAIAKTIASPYYPDISGDLAAGRSPCSDAAGLSTWSNHFYSSC